MAVKKPTSLSAAWWKENKPKSMPKSSIEGLISECGGITAAQKLKLVDDWKKSTTDNDLKVVTEMLKNHTQLVAELKRYQAIVMKEKHIDFGDAINNLIQFAKKDMKDIESAAEVVRKEIRENSAVLAGVEDTFLRSAAKILKDFDSRDKDFSKSITNHLTDILNQAKTAKDSDEFSQLFGKNKFIQAWLKDKIKSVKQEREQLLKDIAAAGNDAPGIKKSSEATLARTSIDLSMKAWDDMKKASQTLDKSLLLECIEKLGKATASTTFMGADKVAVRLSIFPTVFKGLKFKK